MLKNSRLFSGQWPVAGRWRACLLLSAVCLLSASACRRDMQDQPKYKPYREASFFNDKLSTRPLVEGTVARGQLYADTSLYTGKIEGAATGGTNEFAGFDDKFPFPVTKEVVNRGQERYNIFCSSCHGALGDGNGMIARRGFQGIKSYHDDRLRNAPVGYIFDVITNGFGKMQSYAHQVPVRDRWAIISYVRTLQASQPGTVPTPTSNAGGATGTAVQPAASPGATPKTTATPGTNNANANTRPATTPTGGNK